MDDRKMHNNAPNMKYYILCSIVDNSPQLKQGDSWFILPSILVQSHKLIPYALRQVNSLFLILRLGY